LLCKKNNIKNALLGISLGPLVNRKYLKKFFNILINSDLVIFRDKKYKNFISKYFTFEQQNHLSKKNFHNSLDLASFVKFNNISSTKKDKITINLRAIPEDYGLIISHKSYKNIIFQILDNIRNLFPNFEIHLIPMHYFFIGDDDRLFLNEIAFEYNYINLYVQNDNLTLEQTVQNFADSQFAIGNRFHSILLQSFFSDVSYKMDYTDPDFGKIKGFLDRFYSDLELKKTYFNLHTSKSYDNYFDFNFSDIRNKIDLDLLDPYKKIYLDNLSLLMAK